MTRRPHIGPRSNRHGSHQAATWRRLDVPEARQSDKSYRKRGELKHENRIIVMGKWIGNVAWVAGGRRISGERSGRLRGHQSGPGCTTTATDGRPGCFGRSTCSQRRSPIPGQRRLAASTGGRGSGRLCLHQPNVQWSNYKKVLLKPVEFWDNPDTSVSPDDQKMLTSYFYNSLQTNVQKNFTIVDQPGPGVITFAVAIINAETATPGLRSVSLVIPQARILNYAQSFATGHAAFAGSAEAAFKATDSSTGQLLAESVDKRVGGMAVANAAQIQWGDAEAAMDYWSVHITQRAVALGAGTPAATGQPSASN
jgi:hypothetical protein